MATADKSKGRPVNTGNKPYFDWGNEFYETFMKGAGPRAPYEGMSIEELIANMKHNLEVADVSRRNN